jgi:hypothetical protein
MATQQHDWNNLPPEGWNQTAPIEGPPPQREAAFFFGLFLRGHSAEELRRDIAVPREVLRRWEKDARREPLANDKHREMLNYRRQVLAIFDTLVTRESAHSHLRQ